MIGTLVLDGNLIKSKWGDEQLYFRHQMMDDDLVSHPEWDDYLEKLRLVPEINICPYLKKLAEKWGFGGSSD